MSCGDPHEMDCGHVIEQVYLYLDSEMEDDDCTMIRAHLDECAPCLRAFGLEHEIKMLIARSCGGDRAPDELKQRVLVHLRQVRVQIDALEFRAE